MAETDSKARMTRTALLLCALLVAMTTEPQAMQERQDMRRDGIYVTVDPVTGPAITSSPVFDAVIMAERAPMKQYKQFTRITETFDAALTQVAVLAESYQGEVTITVTVIKNGRMEFGRGVQGRQVVAHFNAWGQPYFAVFPQRR